MKVSPFYIVIFLVSVLISSISQIVLKLSAKKEYDSRIKEYLNPMVSGAYILFLSATFMTTMAYKGVPLSFGPMLEATGYVYIALLGTFVLKEKMTVKRFIGNIMIIAGIVIYAAF